MPLVLSRPHPVGSGRRCDTPSPSTLGQGTEIWLLHLRLGPQWGLSPVAPARVGLVVPVLTGAQLPSALGT